MEINLANVYILEQRFAEAERLYIASFKGLARGLSSTSESMFALLELVSYAQFSTARLSDSLKSMLKALHANPVALSFWQNLVVIANHLSSSMIVTKTEVSVEDVENAQKVLNVGVKVLSTQSLLADATRRSRLQV